VGERERESEVLSLCALPSLYAVRYLQQRAAEKLIVR
jgi:hypothetical protein